MPIWNQKGVYLGNRVNVFFPVTSNLLIYLDAANPASYPGTGSTWFDLSGNGNNFTLFNSPTFSNGTLTFNGTNQYARSTNVINFNNFNSLTFDVLAKVNDISSATILFEITANWNTTSGGFGYALQNNGNVFVANRFSTAQWPGPTARVGDFNIGTNWGYHTSIFSKIADSTGRLNYGNGSLIPYIVAGSASTSDTSTSATSFANDFMYLNTRGGGSSFNPITLSTVLVYSTKLTAAQITQNFNAFRGRYGI